MKHIFLNLKRFDVPVELGGVNRLAPVAEWGRAVVAGTQQGLTGYDPAEAEFVDFFPEAHLIPAAAARTADSRVELGCQGVFRADTAVGGNFGAFTTNRPAHAAAALGCGWTLIGHCEERNDKAGILAEAGVTDTAAVNRLLNQEIKCAQAAGLKVLYCIGEKSEEQEAWQQVLGDQLAIGLDGVDVTTRAFQIGLPFPEHVSSFLLMLCLVFFAFTTILGWNYYSEKCLEYLVGNRPGVLKCYRWLYILAVLIGPFMTVSAVWTIADIFNGLMALPNLIALVALSGVVAAETKQYFAEQKNF